MKRMLEFTPLDSWQLAIYGDSKDDPLGDEYIRRAIGGQRNFKCGLIDHDDFLVKESRNTNMVCYRTG